MRLLASDLDGTLVGPSGGMFSPRTRAALDACEAAGVPVVFVTGRPPRWLDGLADGRSGVAICANGALVVDLPTAPRRSRHDHRAGRRGGRGRAAAADVAGRDVRAGDG